MTKRTSLIALTAVAAALPAAPAAARSADAAYFKVSFKAVQHTTWKEHVFYRNSTCDGWPTPTEIRGQGSSTVKLATPRPQPAVARRAGGALGATLQFANGGQALPAAGSYTRAGEVHATLLGPPPPRKCGYSEPIPPDCGTKSFPGGTEIYLAYQSVEAADPDRPAPLFDGVTMSGPRAPGWLTAAPYLNCPEIVGDHELGYPLFLKQHNVFTRDTGRAKLSLRTLFGTRKRFRVFVDLKRTVDMAPVGGEGELPVTTELKWVLTFRRLAHRPAGL
jgi:hypothetical protein